MELLMELPVKMEDVEYDAVGVGSGDESYAAVMEMESVKENMFSARYQRRMSAARVDTGKNDCFHERYRSCGCCHYRMRKELGKEQRMVLIIMIDWS
ncbi:hypothetical protein C5167_013400 [Papaver somniferum]|uniref:Uncharacterized protein n=1 Tax=Papaver somniferum TaxID=3469 RepID=A0A4Y7J4F8_PAPSO|nr:hypothetical protein C5167_013400 [Papaver somniferum]